jgi:hypothetical protein
VGTSSWYHLLALLRSEYSIVSVSARADRLQVGGLPEFVRRAAVDSRSFGCLCVDHSLLVERACRALARAV